MFRRFSNLFLAVAFGCLAVGAYAQNTPIRIGQWRTHLPYTQGHALADGNDKVYCLSDVSFFSVDKSDYTIQKYDKVNGLSDIKSTAIAFSKPYNTLVVAYDNANIDLIKGNTIINVSDLKRKNLTGDKGIYSIYIKGKYAYLCTGFGIVVLDIDKEEISDSYLIGINATQEKVNSLTSDSTYFYAATNSGIYKARLDAANLANYQNWIFQTSLPTGKVEQLATFRNKVFAIWNGTKVYEQVTDSTWTVVALPQDTGSIFVHLDTIKGNLAISEVSASYMGRISLLNSQFHMTTPIVNQNVRYPNQVLQDSSSGLIWIADNINTLLTDDTGSFNRVTVNSPQSTGVSKMSFKGDDLWVGTGGFSNTFSGQYSANGFYTFRNELWENHTQYNTPGLENFSQVYAVKANPRNDKVYFGSVWDGLLIYENGNTTYYTQHNSILQGKTGDAGRTAVTGFAVDDSDNVWISNFYTQKPFVKMKPDGSMQSFGPPFNETGGAADLLIDDYGQIWSVMAAPGSGILVFDPARNLWKHLNTVKGNGALPSSNVYAIAKDKDGSIWVGTDQGIAVFYCPANVICTPGNSSCNVCDAQQIIVTNGGFAGYLLSTEVVTAIVVDGGNRKWVGTTNGLWLFSPDGTQQLAYYNIDNSPLLSNNIACMAINAKTGEMFVGTFNGIISFRTEATEGTDEFVKDNVCVFPNPVKPEFSGLIAIRCLAQNSQVKITDVRGNMVYETTAVGGEATWNGQDYTGRKADTGVYMVYAINKDGSKSYVTKLLFVR